MSSASASDTGSPSEPVSAAQSRPEARRSISEALGGHRNSLGIIRLVLALLVIVDHAFPLSGAGVDPVWELTNNQASLGSIAVLGFFSISGYLIAKSGMTADVLQFLWRRVLRIFPAYWLALVVAAFAVGPLVWIADGHALGSYFSLAGDGPFAYLAKNFTLRIGTYGIYDIFATTTPYGESVGSSVFNGSLWTLIYEFGCYLVVAVFVFFGVLTRARILVPLVTAFLGILQIAAYTRTDIVTNYVPQLADPQVIPLAFAFLAGSTIAVYSKSIIFDDRLGVLAGLVFLYSLKSGGFAVVGVAAGAYFVLYLAARLPRQVQWIGARNDYSYGVYVYGFLMQQVLAYLGVHHWGIVAYIVIAMILSLGCAWVSWHLVEKRAMSLKDWGPGRGVAVWRERLNAPFAKKTSKE